MGRFWALFFMAAAVIAVVFSAVAAYVPSYGWWFPGTGHAMSPVGVEIDGLFYLILIITSITFVLTQIVLGYALWKGATIKPEEKVFFSHGSHALEVIWTIVPSGILLFIALYQLEVVAKIRMRDHFPKKMEPVAEVTARQFEWRIRYPALGKRLMPTPQPDDIYTVNDLHCPTGHPVAISLRTEDVQHAFFLPELRVKQDAVPGLVIPVWFQPSKPGTYDLLCAELCGWGHYKMKAQLVAQPGEQFDAWKQRKAAEQFDDGVSHKPAAEVAEAK